MIKNSIIAPHIAIIVKSALSDRGNDHFLILILQKRSTRGRPIIEKTPDTKM
jgi:hypothetical protein